MKRPPFLSALSPVLRRPLLFCVMALTAALATGYGVAAARVGQEARLRDARAEMEKSAVRLAAARESAAAHAALARRLATLATTLGKAPPDDAGQERIARRLSADTRIAAPRLHLQSAPPPFAPPPGVAPLVVQRLSIDAGLLHEDALLALAATVMDSPEYTLPAGCALHRENGAAVHPLRTHCEFDWISLVPGTGAPR
ncbi:MAG: hypothetical protein LBP86_02810 [Azoarcus sp.]|jgi:hypothetical protein|nr:hypothetical protein [Azoarcus sp.]